MPNHETPRHSSGKLASRAEGPEEMRPKRLLAGVVPGKAPSKVVSAVKASYKDGVATANVSSFGVWCVVADTTPPTVVPSFKSGADLSGAKTMVFTIKDNLAGIASYRVEIDGKWAIMEHHTIQNTLTHHFDDERFGKGKNHTVKVTLKDGSGNSTTITRNYFR